jgi:hypothetical protein
MTTDRPLKECISSNKNELVIFGADSFAQFPTRDASIQSNCDRALPASSSHDLVVLRGRQDHAYCKWLSAHGLGPGHVVEYKESSREVSLSECIIQNPDPILKIIEETGRRPVYVPWYSGRKEAEAAEILGADLFGATEGATIKYNDKAEFKNICQQIGIPVVAGTSFRIQPEDTANARDFARVINNLLATHDTVIIRGTLGESGMSLYKTTGNDLPELYEKIAATGEKMVIVEPFLRVISSPGDQWVIDRAGNVDHIGVTDQVCEKGMVHVGTQHGPQISRRLHDLISQTSLKIVQHMSHYGYCGVLGIDYIVTDENVYPVENNARFNGSSYPWLIADKIRKVIPSIDYWKFIKIKTQPCTFPELADHIHDILYSGEKVNSVLPYNCRSLSVSGVFSVLLLAEDLNHLTYLEEVLNERGVRRGERSGRHKADKPLLTAGQKTQLHSMRTTPVVPQ